MCFAAKPCTDVSIAHSNVTNATGVFLDVLTVSCLPGYTRSTPCPDDAAASTSPQLPLELACSDVTLGAWFEIGCGSDGDWVAADDCTSKSRACP